MNEKIVNLKNKIKSRTPEIIAFAATVIATASYIAYRNESSEHEKAKGGVHFSPEEQAALLNGDCVHFFIRDNEFKSGIVTPDHE